VSPFDYNLSEAARDEAAMSLRNPRPPSDYSPGRYLIFKPFHGSLLCFPLSTAPLRVKEQAET